MAYLVEAIEVAGGGVESCMNGFSFPFRLLFSIGGVLILWTSSGVQKSGGNIGDDSLA